MKSEIASLIRFSDNAALVNELSARIGKTLAHAIAERGRATLAVSGGSTPIPLFEQLSLSSIDWSAVIVTLVDERWVDIDHPDSNAALVRKHLLKNHAESAEFISLKVATSSPFIAEQAVAERLRVIDGPFDVVVLGMGSDGHTASLFPKGEPLQYALEPRQGEPCCGIVEASLAHPRMTLTLPRILNATEIFLHTVGDEKLAVLNQAAEPGPVQQLPIRAILRQHQTALFCYHADH